MKYPHGRRIHYTWGGPGLQDRVVAISADVAGQVARPLVRNVVYDVGGEIESYELATDKTTPNPATSVEYLRLGSGWNPAPTSCTLSRPAVPDATGRLWGLVVSRAPMSAAARTGDVFSRRYAWLADQLVGESTCLLDEATPQTQTYGYDATLQVTASSRPAGEFEASGGAYARREYSYASTGSDRDLAIEECLHWKFDNDAQRLLKEVHPRGKACNGPSTTQDTSWAKKVYTYDADGRMASLTDTPVPGGAGKAITLLPDDGFGAVYREVQVKGAAYQYYYDAQGRRRVKVYPTKATDEYFYDGDRLIEDRGNATLAPRATGPYTLDEYVWLGGLPVAVLKSTFDSGFVRNPRDIYATGCQRNDSVEPCGLFFPVSDYLSKPVVMLDENGRVAGTADYDVFGKVNQVTLADDSPGLPSTNPLYPFGPYPPSVNKVLSDAKQPARTAREAVQVRINFDSINTAASSDAASVEDAQGALLAGPYWGYLMGAVDTPWLSLSPDGVAHVRFRSGPVQVSDKYSGVTVSSYQYRRYEAISTPWWTPLRFPGQYADAESGLFENWNRFYDPALGRYSAADPMTPLPSHNTSGVYHYASNNPTNRFDRDGRDDGEHGEARIRAAEQAREEERARQEALRKKAQGAIDKIAAIPGHAEEARDLQTALDSGRISAAGVLTQVAAALNTLATGNETLAATTAVGIAIVNDTPWTGLDATLVHEGSHWEDQQQGKLNSDPDRNEQGKAYSREKQYIQDRNDANIKRAADADRARAPIRFLPEESRSVA